MAHPRAFRDPDRSPVWSGSQGFSLIELLITVAILAILTTITLPIAEVAVQRAKEQDLRVALREIRHGIDAYKQAYDSGRIQRVVGASGYPPNLAILADGVEDLSTPEHTKIYFLRAIPRDPFAAANATPDDQTWGLRSYSSERMAPRYEDDVYDIYSQSESMGLNGVPYRFW